MRRDDFRRRLLSGLVLRERVDHGLSPVQRTRSKKAQHRLDAWRSLFDFQPEWFEHRMALDHLKPTEFESLVAESESAFAQRVHSDPSWIKDVEKSFRSDQSGMTPDGQLGPLLQPFISAAKRAFETSVAGIDRTHTPLPEDVGELSAMLLPMLVSRLSSMSIRAVTLEINAARIGGSLKGDSSQERFGNFVCNLGKSQGARRFFAHYPVLLSQFQKTCDQWICFSRDFVQHLVDDWGYISARFGATGWSRLVQVVSANSDPHRGGRGVLVPHFESGHRLIYKPRSLAVDVHFQELLSLLNGLSHDDWFQTLNVVDRTNHGWVEYVETLPCTSAESINRFFAREGALLAVLYALSGTDFHHENVLASGAFPVPVDLEGLFHARSFNEDDSAGASLAGRAISESVLASGLLPFRIWQSDSSEGLDFCGMAGAGGQAAPFKVSALRDFGKDSIRFEPAQTFTAESGNRPMFNGQRHSASDFHREVVSGFCRIYRTFMEHRATILEQIEYFRHDEIRCILLPTQSYVALLENAFHPDMLNNGLDRDRWLDRIWRTVAGRPVLLKTMSAQRRDLENNDVPIFVTQPGSCDLIATDGERIHDFFAQPSLDQVRRRVESMSEGDLNRQMWCVKAALAASKASELSVGAPAVPAAIRQEPQTALLPTRSDFVAAAQKIGDQLIARATRSPEGATWLGVATAGQSSWSVGPAGTDLYEGAPGIALFLAWLGEITNHARFIDFAHAAMEYTRGRLRWDQPQTVGAFCGSAGSIYTLTHLAVLWKDETLLEEALAAIGELPAMIATDEMLDVISGVAGCALVLCALEGLRSDQRTRDAIELCAKRLVARASRAGSGVGWLTTLATNSPWTGCSHGSAGFTWALLRVASATHEAQFRNLAELSLAYERGLYSKAEGNWPDLRNFPDQMNYAVAWCHGAPGIGLARLQTLDLLDDEMVRTEINAAIRTTLNCVFADNLSLCHGYFGNADTLLEAGRLIDPVWIDNTRSTAGHVLEYIRAGQITCGVPLGIETPGLMTGLAGIGYGLLRLAYPEAVPSVLGLQLPCLAELARAR